MTLYEGLAWAIGLSAVQWPLAVLRAFLAKRQHSYNLASDLGISGRSRGLVAADVFLSPILEELLLCYLVRPEAGVWTAAILFGVAHAVGDQPRGVAILRLIGTTCLGVICGKVWLGAGLWQAIVVHYTWNLVAFCSPYIQMWIERWRGLSPRVDLMRRPAFVSPITPWEPPQPPNRQDAV